MPRSTPSLLPLIALFISISEDQSDQKLQIKFFRFGYYEYLIYGKFQSKFNCSIKATIFVEKIIVQSIRCCSLKRQLQCSKSNLFWFTVNILHLAQTWHQLKLKGSQTAMLHTTIWRRSTAGQLVQQQIFNS